MLEAASNPSIPPDPDPAAPPGPLAVCPSVLMRPSEIKARERGSIGMLMTSILVHNISWQERERERKKGRKKEKERERKKGKKNKIKRILVYSDR